MSAIVRGDLLRYRLPSFRAKVVRAEAIVSDALAVTHRPYVAWSTGKESTVVLALVRAQRPDVTVNWTDEELVHDECPVYAAELAHAWQLNLLVTCGHDLHADWFWSWSWRPPWRAPMPGAIDTGVRHTHLWLRDHGYDGVFLGLRKEEAAHRRRYLAAKGRLHAAASRGGWNCNPLAGWTVDDVWAYIAGERLPYNPVYDRLAEIGVPRAEQRVGPLPLSPGWILRLGWPVMYRRLVERYGLRWGG